MKKIVTLCFLMALVCVKGWGQASAYSFNATAGSYTAITGTSASLTAGSADEGYYNGIPLGFSFSFNGTTYTYAHVSTNGWLTLGTSATNNRFTSITNGAAGSPVYDNSLANSTIATRPIIAPLWDDMSTTSLTYTTNTSGGTGNYITTIQYNNVKWNYQASTAVVSFQVKFYQATNAVQFVYTPVAAANINNASATIGIAGGTTGSSTTNFLSVNDVTTAATASSSSETTSIATVPASGITFTFTPPTYTAQNSGDWNTANTWDKLSVPTAGSNVIIPNSYSVTDAAAITAQPSIITINSGGSLTFNAAYTNPSGSTITVASGSTLAVGATLTNSNTTAGAITISGTFQLNQGGTFTSANTTTSILTYTSGSTLIYNYTTPYTATDYEWTRPGGNRPTNVTINGGTITIASGERNIAGTLTLNGSLNLVGNLSSVLNTVANATATVSGSGLYTQTASGSFTTANPLGVNGTLTTTGTIMLPTTTSFTFNGTSVQVTGTLLPATVAALTISNTAGVTISNSALTISGTTTLTNGAVVLPIASGNLVTFTGSISTPTGGGTLTGSATSNIVTAASPAGTAGTLSFTPGGALLNNWTHQSTAFGASTTTGLASVVAIYGTFSLPSTGSSNFYTTSTGGLIIQSGATYTDNGASNNRVLGAGSFADQPGGTTVIANTGGLTATAATGAIQTTTRTFSGGANYTFNYAGSQAIGDALDGTSGIGKTGPITGNVVIAGIGTSLTLNAGTTITINAPGSFTLGSSSLPSTLIAPATSVINGSGNVTFLGSGTTLQTANVNGVNGTFAGTGTFSFTNGTNNNTNFVFNGATAQVTGSLLPATVNNLTINNTTASSSPTIDVTLSSSVTVSGIITFTVGRLSIGANNTLTLNGSIVMSTPNMLGGINTSNLIIGGAGTIGTSAIMIGNGGAVFNNFTMNRSGQALTLGANVTVAGTFSLTNGVIVISTSTATLSLNGPIAFGSGTLTGNTNNQAALAIGGAGTISGNLIATGTAPSTLALSTLTMNRGGATLSLGSNVTVLGASAVVLSSGNISLGAYNLTNLSTTGGSFGAGSSSSMIVATGTGRAILTVPSGASTQTFPVGDGSNYTPATIAFTANNTLGTLACNVTASTHPSLNTGNTPSDYLKRYWSFTASSFTSYTYSGTFKYVAGDVVGTEAKIKADRWDGSGWSEIPGSSASTKTLTTASGLTNMNASLSATCDYTGRVSPVITLLPNTLAAGNIVQNTTVNPIYSFAITVAQTDASLTGLSITTAGTFTTTDISNLKVYSQTSNVFNLGSATLLSTLNNPGTTNPKTFPSFTPLTIPVGTTRYIFITADIACATIPNTVSIKSTTPTFAAGTYNPAATAEGNLQTFTASTPTNVTGPAAAATGASTVSVSWAAPSGCYTQVMIVASPAINTGGTPTGNGSAYTDNPTYGSGTPFGNGYVVYKGTASLAVISGLTSNTKYYFKIFTNNGTLWTSGIEVNATTNDATLVTDYFRSVQTGNWSDATTWQSSHNGITWITATTTPTSSATSILLQNPNIVTVTSNVSGAQMVIQTGITFPAILKINSGVTFTLANGTNTIDCDVSGNINNIGTIVTTGVLAFENGSKYNHNQNGGTIPAATWNTGSLCTVTGTTSTVPSGLSQSFADFTWNSDQSASISLAGALTTVNGNLSVLSTSSSNTSTSGYYLGLFSTSGTLTVGGSFIMSGSTYPWVIINYGTGSTVVNIAGSLTMAGSTALLYSNYVNSGTCAYNITGDCSLAGYDFKLNYGATTTSPVLAISGALTVSAGYLDMNGYSTTAGATVNVTGAGGTTVSGTGSISMDDVGTSGICSLQTTSFTANGTGNSSTNGLINNCSVEFGDGGTTVNHTQIKISGNFSHSSSNVFYTSSGTKVGSFIFNGNATDVASAQTLSYTGTGSDYTSYTINSGTYVRLLTGLTLSPNNVTGPISSFIVNGTLDCNTFTLAAGGIKETFALNSGGTLVTANPNGVYSGTTGSISNAFGASATFNSNANYVFSGATSQTANFNNTTMNNLGIANTAGTVTLNAAITVGGNVLINSGGGSLTGGNFAHTVKGNWANSGTYIANTGTVSFAGTSPQTLNGTTTFNNLTFANSAGFTLNNTQTVGTSGILTLTSGVVNITSGLLSVANTSATAINGGSAAAYVNGPLRRALPSVSGASSAFVFPVGKGGNYYPFGLTPSSTTTPVITAEVFNANSGGTPGTGLCSISNTEYWLATVNSGTYSNGTIALTRPAALSSLNRIGRSSTLTGAYASLGNNASTSSGASGYTITSTDPTGTSLGYFVMGTSSITAFSYTTPVSYCVGQTYTNTPIITGTATSFAVIGTALPNGLSLNTSTGVISGIPTTPTPAANYTIRATNACSSIDVVVNITVNPNASVGSVTGTSPLCIGATATYSANSVVLGGSGTGAWSSSNTAVATVNSSGVVTAIAAGTTNIIYTVTGGCGGTASAQQPLTVSPSANAGTISGTTPLCINATATYTSNGDAGGAWASSNPSVATVSSTGVVTAKAAGTTNITYTVTGCNAPPAASKSLTVSPNAVAGTISGTTPLCINATATYTSNGDAGGAWSSSNTAVATVNATSGVVTAVGAGTATITYTVSTGCNNPVSASKNLAVNPLPTASFTLSNYSACGSGVAIGVSGTNGATVNYSFTGPNSGSGSVMLTGGNATTDGTGTINSLSGTGTYNYTITSITNGCTGYSTSTTTATIYATPTINLAAGSGTRDQKVCINTSITSIKFDVTNAAATPTVSGLPAGFPAPSYSNGVLAISGSSGAPGTYPYTVTVPGGSCGNVTDGGTIVIAAYIWTGGTSTVWTDGSNWCSGTPPGSGADVTISPTANHYPVLPSDPTTTVGNLVISNTNASGTLTIGDNHTLIVNGTITGSGTLTGSAKASLETKATTTVTFTSGSSFLQNLTVSGGTLTLGNALDITAGATPGIVTVSGTGQLATAGNLTLKSDIDGTASIGLGAAAGGYITGAVTSERYTDAGKGTTGRRAWRLVTSPVSQTIHDAWQEGGSTTITGFGTQITGEGFTDATAANAQGYDYIGGGNHTSIKHYTGGAWVPLDANVDTRTTGVRSEPAYMLFVRGDRTIGSAQSTAHTYTNLRAKGNLIQGDQSPVGLTPNSTLTLVGNPYASTIDFSKIFNSNTTISNKFYLWNSKYGTYGAYVLIAPGSTGYIATPDPLTTTVGQLPGITYQYIPSGSGFFVFPNSVSSNPGSLIIHEADKAAGNRPPVNPFRVVTATNVRELAVNLNQKDNDTSVTLADGFRARFSNDYAGNEEDNSSQKAWNFNENLNLVHGGKSHIIEAHSDVQETDTLFMKMWNVTKRSYQLQMRADNFTPAPGIQAWLVDNYSGTKQVISLAGNVVSFDFSVNADSSSAKSDRFMIVFQNNSAVLPVTLTSLKAVPANGGVNVTWTVNNEVNIKQYTIEKSADGGATYTAIGIQPAKNNPDAVLTSYQGFDAAPKMGDNLYRIRIEAKDGTVSYSSVVKVTIGADNQRIEITIYPNPVRGGKVNLQMTNLAAGTYLAALYSEGGQSVYQRKITISQPNTTQSEELKLGKGLAQGSYQLQITDSKGNVVKETTLVVAY